MATTPLGSPLGTPQTMQDFFSGTVSIDPSSLLFLGLVKDAAQQACLISSQGSMTGSFSNAAEGSTITDYGADQGDVVGFSYQTPGGPGCYPHAFTAQTGIDPKPARSPGAPRRVAFQLR